MYIIKNTLATYTILLPQIVIGAPKMCESAAENSLQQTSYLLLLE